jgi:type I restriction enzyme, R subunit
MADVSRFRNHSISWTGSPRTGISRWARCGFSENVAHRINGRAKATIVTRSRLHAVRYHRALERYLTEQSYDYGALVAFSGTVRDGGIDHTEANLNGIPETQTRDAFERAENRFLVVANKFQTGFDQPLLHTMYVDRSSAA